MSICLMTNNIRVLKFSDLHSTKFDGKFVRKIN